MMTMNFKFDPELPESWYLSVDELEPYLIDLPIDDEYTFEEMKEPYINGVPTVDLSFYKTNVPWGQQIHSCISGDKDRLIWAKWKVAITIAITEKYDVTLCSISYDGNNFQIWELFGISIGR